MGRREDESGSVIVEVTLKQGLEESTREGQVAWAKGAE